MLFLDLREPVSAWSHGSWLLLSLPATWLLWRRSGGDRARRFSMLVFGLSLTFCYAGSMLYHGVRLSPQGLYRFDQLDHIGIFILIAGSYTPIVWNLMQGRWKWGTLTLAWLSSTVGSALILTCGVLPILWSTLFYLVMGWGALVCYIELMRVLSHRALFPLLLGGLFYSVGAILNVLHWPVIWSGVFEAHEVFHLLVMAGSLCHFWFVLKVVVPYSGAKRPASVIETVSEPEPALGPAVVRGGFQPSGLRASPRAD